MALNFKDSKNASRAQQMQQRMSMESNSMISKMIPVESIIENEDNERIYGMHKLEALMQSIEDEGFTDPIGVYDLKDGRYEIFTGHKRYRAVLKLGKKTVACVVFPMPKDNIERAKRLIRSNSLNRDYDPLTRARELQYYYENVIVPQKENGQLPGTKKFLLAQEFEISESNVHRLLSLLNLIPQLQELANNQSLPYSAFSPASKLSVEKQEELYQMIVQTKNEEDTYDATKIEISRWIKQLSNENNGIEELEKVPATEPEVVAEHSSEQVTQREESGTSEKVEVTSAEVKPLSVISYSRDNEANEPCMNTPVEEKSSDEKTDKKEAGNKEKSSTPLKTSVNIVPALTQPVVSFEPKVNENGPLSYQIIPPSAKADLDFIIKLQLSNLKEVKAKNYKITEPNVLKDNITELITILSEFKKELE